MRKSAFPEIDKQLYQCFLRMRSNNNEISGYNFAKSGREQLGAREELTASHMFLNRFKNRYRIKFKKLHGQAGEVFPEVVHEWCAVLHHKKRKH